MRVSLLSYKMPELKGTQTGVFSKIPRHDVTHDQRYFETSYKRSYDKVDEVQNVNSHSKLDKFAGWESGFLKPEKIKITTKLIAEKYNTGTDNKFNSSIQRTWIGYKDPGMKAVEDYKIDNTKELILPPIDNEFAFGVIIIKMMMDVDNSTSELESQIMKYMGQSEVTMNIQAMVNNNGRRLAINIDKVRNFDANLASQIINNPMKVIPLFEANLQDQTNEILSSSEKQKTQKDNKSLLSKKQVPYKITFEGTFGKNMVSPRGLTADLTNQFVCVQGIVTRMSIVRPKLVHSVHYSEATKQGSVKEYHDSYSLNQTAANGNLGAEKFSSYVSNAVPVKDIHGNPLDFEYGLSFFRDFQTLLVQEPPERTPVGQLPRSVEIVLEDDLVDRVKPGDRIQVSGIFKCISSISTSFSGVVKTVLVASNIQSITAELETPKFSGEDLRNIKEIANRNDCFEVLANSIAPGIYGHNYIKKALILQLLGGIEKNLENGTHLRGDINVMLIGDPSTAKSQFLRHMMSLAPNSINTTGRGSSGVGLTAAVVVDKDTGERHLEAGAMVLADRGIVCIDEFDKMNEADRVAIHEVMEQQTVTIAKAGIHVSLNARCSVLAAANPIYGEYQKDMPAAKNIGLPDSLLSRFDLLYIVLDEHDSENDRRIADRVIRNHMFPADTPTIMNMYDEKIIEPEIHADDYQNSQVFEKYNTLLHGSVKKDILTRSFLRKYLHYSKKATPPALTDEATKYISTAWTQLRNKADEDESYKATPITVRTLETLIRLASAHAKLRLSKAVSKKDCEVAFEMLNFALYHETGKEDDTSSMVDAHEPVPADKATSKAIGKKSVSSGKKSRGMIVDEEESESIEEESEISDKKQEVKSSPMKTRSSKKESRDIDQVFNSRISSNEPVSDAKKRFLFKIINDTVYRRDFPQLTFEELWNIIKNNNEASTKYNIESKSDLLDVILVMDTEGKLLYSNDSKDITLIL